MIKLHLLGGLGNNLFQYAFARLLAEELGYAVEISLAHRGGPKDIDGFVTLMSLFADAPLSISGKSFFNPKDESLCREPGGFDGFVVDWDSLIQKRDDRQIHIRGFFERYELYRDHKSKLRQWFSVAPKSMGYEIDPQDIVVHVRRGDFAEKGRSLSLDYYDDLLQRLRFRKLFVCGVGIDDKVKSLFNRYSPVYVQHSPADDFLFIKGFNRIIQSQSTFVWWAAFLSDAEEIYAPVPLSPLYKFERKFDKIDIRVDDEARYHITHRVQPDIELIHLEDMFAANRYLTVRERLRLWPAVLSRDVLRGSFRSHGTKKKSVARRFAKAIRKTRRALKSRRRAITNRGQIWMDSTRFGPIGSWARSYYRWQIKYRRQHYRRGRYVFDQEPIRRVSDSRLEGYDRVLLITINHSYAGFFSYFTFALNQLLFCERNNCFPIVAFGPWSKDGPNAYYDPAHGENVWEYYFEPVAGVGFEEYSAMEDEGPDSDSAVSVYQLKNRDLSYLHAHCADSIFGYTYGRNLLKTAYDDEWYGRQRQVAARVTAKYVRVKSDIREEIDAFYDLHMRGRHVLGIHIRGTDKGTAMSSENAQLQIRPEEYVALIDRYLACRDKVKIFVATDQKQHLEYIQSCYGDRVIHYDAIRSSNSRAPFQIEDGRNYQKGKDVLIDCQILSRCAFLMKCSSHVGEAALYFNPELESIDLNYPVEGQPGYAKILQSQPA